MPLRRRHLGYAIAAAGLLIIVALTLLPTPEEAERAARTPVYCIVCGDLGTVDFLLNTLLFIPLGIGLALAGFSWRRAVVLAGVTTFAIELLQMKVIAGRDGSLGDILANTLGTGLGALLAAYWRGIAYPDALRARRMALAYALTLVWIWAGTAWALGPAFPQGARWFGAWAPDLANFENFPGRVLSGSVSGEALLPGRALDQQRLEDAVTARPYISFLTVLGAPPEDLAPIGLIVDEWQRNVLLIGQDKRDLMFGLRMRASIVKLRNPTALLTNGMAGHPGDTVDAGGALRNGAFELNSRNGDRLASLRLPLSASWGWSLITPWNPVLGDEVRSVTAFWIIGLLAILAYWCVLAGGPTLTILPATMLVLFGAIPYAAGFPAAHWSEWAAALVGLIFGGLAARAARRARLRSAPREYEVEPSLRMQGAP